VIPITNVKRLPSFADSIKKRGRVPSGSYGKTPGSWLVWSKKGGLKRIGPITTA
jgi:hypothetical protein